LRGELSQSRRGAEVRSPEESASSSRHSDGVESSQSAVAMSVAVWDAASVAVIIMSCLPFSEKERAAAEEGLAEATVRGLIRVWRGKGREEAMRRADRRKRERGYLERRCHWRPIIAAAQA
jgi:hypothetical protein